MINIYKHKYLKYKFKYNKLKFQLGGNINRIEADKIYDTDPSIAFQLYQKAAEEGDIKSYYILSEMYKKGHGVKENLLESIKLYKIANIHTFNNFLVTMFIPEELRNKDKLYLFIGTFPYIYLKNEWKAGESYKMVENSIEYNLIIKDVLKEHNNKLIRDKRRREELDIQTFKYFNDEPLSEEEIKLSNRIYYFIDKEYNEFYRNILKLYLTSNSYDSLGNFYNSVYYLPIKFITGDNFIRIEFTRLNIVIYIIEMIIPSEYNFSTHNLTSIDSDYQNQMSYTKECTLSEVWIRFYSNILNFLENHKKEFYLFNDALIYSGQLKAQNRYFEFFCEFGYILYKLNENNKGDQVYVVFPNDKTFKFINDRNSGPIKLENNILPKFKKLNEIYNHNFGDKVVKIEDRRK